MLKPKYVGILFLCIGLGIGAGTVFLLHKKTTPDKHKQASTTTQTLEEQVIDMLQEAFADEWLAYYQYWIGALVVKKTNSDSTIDLQKTIAELKQHADDELRHAKMIARRIIALGGTPLLEPQAWYKHTSCGYTPPSDPAALPIIFQNIKAEQCAIDFYKKLMILTKGKDQETYKMAKEILNDEIEHEEDLQKLLPPVEKK